MEREHSRYLIFKCTDAHQALTWQEIEQLVKLASKVEKHRELRLDKIPLECVVIESDWPEYELVWKMLEDRVDGIRREPT